MFWGPRQTDFPTRCNMLYHTYCIMYVYFFLIFSVFLHLLPMSVALISCKLHINNSNNNNKYSHVARKTTDRLLHGHGKTVVCKCIQNPPNRSVLLIWGILYAFTYGSFAIYIQQVTDSVCCIVQCFYLFLFRSL